MEWRSKRPPPFIARNILGGLIGEDLFPTERIYRSQFRLFGFHVKLCMLFEKHENTAHGKSKKGTEYELFFVFEIERVCGLFYGPRKRWTE